MEVIIFRITSTSLTHWPAPPIGRENFTDRVSYSIRRLFFKASWTNCTSHIQFVLSSLSSTSTNSIHLHMCYTCIPYGPFYLPHLRWHTVAIISYLLGGSSGISTGFTSMGPVPQFGGNHAQSKVVNMYMTLCYIWIVHLHDFITDSLMEAVGKFPACGGVNVIVVLMWRIRGMTTLINLLLFLV